MTGYSSLTTVLGGQYIYDHVPQNTPSPYVRIGEFLFTADDTKTANGWNCTFSVHSWTFEAAGTKAVQTIMGHVYDALHKQESNVTVTGFSLIELHCEFTEAFPEQAEGASDKYYHGVQRFRALITDTTS